MVKETWILAPLFDINPLNQICWYKFSEQNRFYWCKSDKNPLKYWKLKFLPREFFFEKKGNKFKFNIYPSTHRQTDRPTDRLNRSKKHIDKFTFEQGQIARGKMLPKLSNELWQRTGAHSASVKVSIQEINSQAASGAM